MPNNNGQFDTDIEIVTPENIAFRYRVAGPFRRLPAYLIDLMIRIMIAVAGLVMFSILAAILGFVIGNVMFGMGMMLTLVLWFLLAWFYGGFLETYYNGQTPGKRLMQIRVISVDGQPINGLQAVLRNVLRTVDAQPAMLYLAGLVTATRNSRFQRLGDLACGTMVVVEQPHWMQGLVRLGTPEVQRMAAAIPPSFQASRSLARALAAYVHRRQNFSVLRRLEIAREVLAGRWHRRAADEERVVRNRRACRRHPEHDQRDSHPACSEDLHRTPPSAFLSAATLQGRQDWASETAREPSVGLAANPVPLGGGSRASSRQLLTPDKQRVYGVRAWGGRGPFDHTSGPHVDERQRVWGLISASAISISPWAC